MAEIEEWMLPKIVRVVKPTKEDIEKAVELDLLN